MSRASAVPALSTNVTVTVRRRLALGLGRGERWRGGTDDHGVDRARRGRALTPLVADHTWDTIDIGDGAECSQ